MSIQHGPHYRLHSTDLADWLERQGIDIWWTVDDDPILMTRISLPGPADELAALLGRLNRPLLVEDRREKPAGHGESISVPELDALFLRYGDGVPFKGQPPAWANERMLSLSWDGSDNDWLLMEDSMETEASRRDALEAQNARK